MSGDEVDVVNGPEKVRREGGRAAKVVAAVHAATLELLAERGYDRMEIPEIAERAQVNKTSIYRRWPSKSELVLEVALTRIGAEVPMPDTGSLVGDLTILIQRLAVAITSPVVGGLLRALILSGDAPAVKEARKTFWDERFRASGVLVERAIARGEMPVGTPARQLVEFAVAPMFYRVLMSGDAVNFGDLEEMARRAVGAYR